MGIDGLQSRTAGRYTTLFTKSEIGGKMRVESRVVASKNFNWKLRNPEENDALELSKLRIEIDSETENLAREAGEAVLDEKSFIEIIREDNNSNGNLFLVAEVNGRLVGFARCVQMKLKRFSHQNDFGICILQEYCGQGIGNQLLKVIIDWSEKNNIEKISLNVIEENEGAINMYKRNGFVHEGLLLKDRKHSDGSYHNTVLMGRISNKL